MPVIDAPESTGVANEPVLTTASVVAFVSAVIALIVAFGVDLTSGQQVAILGVTAVVAPAVVIVARRWVTPTVRVVEYAKDGKVLAGPANERRATDTRVRDLGGPVQPPAVTATPSETSLDGYEAKHYVDADGDGKPDYTPKEH